MHRELVATLPANIRTMNTRLRHAVHQVVWYGGSVVRLLGLVMVFITGYAKSVRIILVRSLIGKEMSNAALALSVMIVAVRATAQLPQPNSYSGSFRSLYTHYRHSFYTHMSSEPQCSQLMHMPHSF